MVMVRVPATSANLGPGFDTIGMALELYNYVEMRERPGGLRITVSGHGANSIPVDEHNIVYRTATKVFQMADYDPEGLDIRLENYVPVGKGLGSSAAALVGGAVAANALAGFPFSREELLDLVNSIEGHPDNVAPALLGKMVVAVQGQGGKVIQREIIPPPELQAVVAIPHFTVPTKKARDILPRQVPVADAVFNISRVSLLVLAMATGDLELFGQMMDDRLHQPYRTKLVPGMEDVFQRARGAGALGVALSGAGPTVIAFATDGLQAIGEAMEKAFQAYGVRSTIMTLKPCLSGAQVVDESKGGLEGNEYHSSKIWG